MDFFRLSMFSNFQILNAWLWVSCGWQWMPGWRGDNIQRLDCPLPGTGTTHYQLPERGTTHPPLKRGQFPMLAFQHSNMKTIFSTLDWPYKMSCSYQISAAIKARDHLEKAKGHTWYLSRAPRACLCKFFLAGVNFYRFNAKNWQFTVYFAVTTQKIGNFLCILS